MSEVPDRAAAWGSGYRKRAAQWATRFMSTCVYQSAIEATRRASFGLAVRGLILVDDALGDGDVQLARGNAQGGQSLVLIAGLNGLAGMAHQGLSSDFTDWLRTRRFSVGRMRFFWDLMFATVGFLLDVCLAGSVRAVSRPGLRRGDTRKRS